IASLGFSTGEALLTVIAVAAIAALGWRWSYAAAAVVVLLIYLPLARWLLAGHAARHAEHLAASAVAEAGAQAASWTRGQMMRDLRFWLLMPGIFAPSLILTAMFINHRYV